jgi:hypothetical protein
VTQISTTAQLSDNAERFRRLTREINEPLTTQRLTALEGVGSADTKLAQRFLPLSGDQRHPRSASELSRACQRSIDTTSDNGIRGSQPAVSSSGFCRKCVT